MQLLSGSFNSDYYVFISLQSRYLLEITKLRTCMQDFWNYDKEPLLTS